MFAVVSFSFFVTQYYVCHCTSQNVSQAILVSEVAGLLAWAESFCLHVLAGGPDTLLFNFCCQAVGE
jgi:hypothetical protein